MSIGIPTAQIVYENWDKRLFTFIALIEPDSFQQLFWQYSTAPTCQAGPTQTHPKEYCQNSAIWRDEFGSTKAVDLTTDFFLLWTSARNSWIFARATAACSSMAQIAAENITQSAKDGQSGAHRCSPMKRIDFFPKLAWNTFPTNLSGFFFVSH